jgi:hypothetical protein
MFTVDGMIWTYPCDIERVTEITASEISGMLLNKNYFNDVLGAFLSYTITIVVPIGGESEYTRLYNILTDPVDAHVFSLPYNEGSITINGRVENISDVYKRMPNGAVHWKGIKINVIANAPHKTHTLGEAINRGITPFPNVAEPEKDVVYQFDGTEWIPADFQNADNISY